MLTEEQISRYQEVHRQVCGGEISREKALAQGTALVNLMRTVYQPLPLDQLENARSRVAQIINPSP